MTITIITVGSKSKPEISVLIDSFTKRLPKNITLNWVYIKSGDGDISTSMRKEAESILRAVPKNNKIMLLDETGVQMTSQGLSSTLFTEPKDTTIIIGGAHGVDERIKEIANNLWSLSHLVFPHQLVRLILAEQIYRAHTISIGHPYHHS